MRKKYTLYVKTLTAVLIGMGIVTFLFSLVYYSVTEDEIFDIMKNKEVTAYVIQGDIIAYSFENNDRFTTYVYNKGILSLNFRLHKSFDYDYSYVTIIQSRLRTVVLESRDGELYIHDTDHYRVWDVFGWVIFSISLGNLLYVLLLRKFKLL